MKKIRKKLIGCTIALILLMVLYVLYTLFGGKADVRGRVVICIPVYGQSLALGEEAVRVTDFNSLRENYNGRIVTENLDYRFGFYDVNALKQTLKKLLHWKKRSYELSVYGMAETLASQLGEDTIICTFPGGQGTTYLQNLRKGTKPYKVFLENIKKAHRLTSDGGGRFVVPAICWVQGESDITDYPGTNFKELLDQFKKDFNTDVRAITGQREPVRFICYQTNALTRGSRFDRNSFNCVEIGVPQAMVELIRDDSLFWASGPTYPYTFVREAIHIDGVGQKCLGALEGRAALGILHHGRRLKGLIPLSVETADSTVFVNMNVPCPPLLFDTSQVRKTELYGFSVIMKDGTNIAKAVTIDSCKIVIKCRKTPAGCKVRYAVNGENSKSGNQNGPRGNLRDSQGDKERTIIKKNNYPLHNWCYQFEETIPNQQQKNENI